MTTLTPKNGSCMQLKPFDFALRATLRANGILTSRGYYKTVRAESFDKLRTGSA